jgi:hypothetical protein
MEKEFVTYEQALALKELGFDEKCITEIKYKKICEEQSKPNGCQLHNLHCNYPDCTIDRTKTPIGMPLKQQVFKFFRDKFNQHSFIELVEDDGIKYDYCLYVDKSPEECIDFGDGPHNTYEEAENACIDKLIQLFK